MAKQQLRQCETQVQGTNGIGKQLEQTYTVDDSCLPSAVELEAYQRIDTRIVDYLLDSSTKEQNHRHNMDASKLRIIRKADARSGRMNFYGMLFAFLSIFVMMAVAAFSLYLNRPWFAAFIGGTALVTVVSIFVKGNEEKPTKTNTSKK
jgi:uncharacterized membrane protein